jgi:uncharacterized protein YllA (UPF0747 family)
MTYTVSNIFLNEESSKLLMQYMNKHIEFAKKGKYHLEEFIKLGSPDPQMIDSARKIIIMLDSVLSKINPQ